MTIPLTRTRALVALAVITFIGGVLRFYNLAWGAPYYHFHIDEHFVFLGADLLRRSMEEAAMSPKYFMYGPGPGHILNVLRSAYELFAHPLNLTTHNDGITYMVLGRAVSATLGTVTIPLVYAIAARISGRAVPSMEPGRLAGLLAATFLAFTVIHLRDSHFLTVDISMIFFCVLTWLALLGIAESGNTRTYIATGLAIAGALLCKYTAVFMAIPVAVAHLLTPIRPRSLQPIAAWRPWIVRGAIAVVVAVAAFLIFDPMVIRFWDKFRDDVRSQIQEPLTGATQPIFFGHFADVDHPRLYWFTNLLWWGMGPALEIFALAGLVWLLTRRTKAALLSAIVPVAYFLFAGNSVAPFVRYALPLATTLTVAAGVFAADWIQRPRRAVRITGMLIVGLVLLSTALYAVAYMNVFRQEDSRVRAARWIHQRIPPGAKILIEPSHNIPPMGSYFTAMDFYRDYVLWGRLDRREDRYHLLCLDTYVLLYDRRRTPDEKRAYIASRLAEAEWIVMDDTFIQFYEHLPERDHGVVQQYYRDLLAGRLGFTLVRSFKVYPSLFGQEINDDRAELSFRLFDHPRVFVFRRQTAP